MAAPDASVPSAVDMSSASAVVWLNTSFPAPASLRTFVNVSSRFSADWIASSSCPVLLDRAVARSPTCSAVTPAAAPVCLITFAVSLPIFSDSAAAS
jgi:hypothetical protein